MRTIKSAAHKVLARFPRLKRLARRVHAAIFPSGRVSYAYQQLDDEHASEEGQRLRNAWQSDTIPARQRALVDRQLAQYRRGHPIDVFDVMVEALNSLDVHENAPKEVVRTLLEVGCSSGFYSEVLKIKRLNVVYSGCDYSPAFIELGQKCYPGVPFSVQDATALAYPDTSFDVVVSGCCLLHIPEFEKAISETARVAKAFAIFHRTPVVTGLPHQYFRKQAYGVTTVEIHFNEGQLLDMFLAHGLELLQVFTLSQDAISKHPGAQRCDRTYVCKKVRHAV